MSDTGIINDINRRFCRPRQITNDYLGSIYANLTVLCYQQVVYFLIERPQMGPKCTLAIYISSHAMYRSWLVYPELKAAECRSQGNGGGPHTSRQYTSSSK